MPVNPIVPDTVEARHFVGLPNGEQALNIYNVDIGPTDVLDAAEANNIASPIMAAFATELAPVISTTVVSQRVVVTDLRVLNGPQFSIADGTPGGDATSPLPTQVAACIAWHTNTRGRSFRGRTMLAGFTEGGSLGQNPTGTVLTALEDWATDLLALLTAAGRPLVIVSRFHQVVPGTPPTVPRVTNIATPVTSFVIDQAWKTQRTRALRG